MKKMMAALAAVSLMAAPAMAQSSASKLSLSSSDVARSASATGDANLQSGGFPFLIVFVVIAVGAGLYFAVENSDDGRPTSP